MQDGTISRRNFLKAAAGVSACFIIPGSAPGRTGSEAPGNRITMGCIGVGGQGTYNMKAFLGIPEVQVVAVCDVETQSDRYYGGGTAGRQPAKDLVEKHYAGQRRSGTYKGCSSYRDFRELLDREDIDAVTVCTPDHWHGLISAAAARAGKDIYCEKPLTNTIAEGRAVCNAVKRYGRILQTGSHERSNNSTRFAGELVRNGRIGKLHTIRINMPTNVEPHHQAVNRSNIPEPPVPAPASLDYDMWLGPAPFAPYSPRRSHFWWRFILAYGGGEMTDRGAHIIDLAQLGNNTDHTGPVEFVAKGAQAGYGIFDAFMKYEFECRYANGVRLIGTTNGPRGLKFEGTDGWIFVNIHGGRLEASRESLLEEVIGPGEVHLGRSPGHRRDFIDSVKTRRQPMAPAEVGHRTATICHLLNIAMLTGEKLKWDPQREQITNSSEANRYLTRPMRGGWHL